MMGKVLKYQHKHVRHIYLSLNGKNTDVTGSGVHRLFEGQGRKEGHFSACFGSQEGTLARFGAQEGSLACILTPKKAL